MNLLKKLLTRIQDFSWSVWMLSASLKETINVFYDSLFSNGAKVSNINRTDFEKLFEAALQNNFFNFERKFINKLIHCYGIFTRSYFDK